MNFLAVSEMLATKILYDTTFCVFAEIQSRVSDFAKILGSDAGCIVSLETIGLP